MRFSWLAASALVLVPTTLVFASSCSGGSSGSSSSQDAATAFAAQDAAPDAAQGAADGSVVDASFVDVQLPPASEYCGLPGSVVFAGGGRAVVPGGPSADLSFLTLPDGFCAHAFAQVPCARALRFAPGGELFVASPSTSTAGSAPMGPGEIDVLADDDKDGVADAVTPFMTKLPSTQGMLFTSGYFWYQDGSRVLRIPYLPGQRSNVAVPTQMVDVQIYNSTFHWPKTLDQADDGRVYVTNGGEQTETCVSPHPFHGGVLEIDGTPGGKPVAQGFRNPMYMRCQRGHDHCFLSEMTRDFSSTQGGREKLVMFSDGQDWGFPCCASKDLAFPDIMPAPDCSMVEPDDDSFRVGDSPFGLDFEPNAWSGAFAGNIFVALHGAVGTWVGARVIAVQTDPATGKPPPGTTTDGGAPTGAMRTFASGWDDTTRTHGRPSDVTFSSDGRLFIANDYTGEIFWVAPIGLAVKK